MSETLEDLKARKTELEAKIIEAKIDYKSKLASLKTKLVMVESEIFQKEEGFYAMTARKVAGQHPEFMRLVQAEIEKAEMEAKVAPVGSRKTKTKASA